MPKPHCDEFCHGPHPRRLSSTSTLQQTLRKGLRGLSYIGMIESALYVNIAPGTRWSGKRAVSWHVHAICWGEKRKQMRKRFARLNKQGIYRSIMPGQRGAHQKEIPRKCLTDNSRTFFADKIRYMLKPPCKAYRIYHAKNPKNGEVVSFRQFKSDLRPGDHVDLVSFDEGALPRRARRWRRGGNRDAEADQESGTGGSVLRSVRPEVASTDQPGPILLMSGGSNSTCPTHLVQKLKNSSRLP